MSSTSTRLKLAEAQEIAEQLVALIALSCVRVVVAGSIRRGSTMVGDIDLLCEPIVEPLVDMFGEPTGEGIDRLHERLCDMERRGTIGKRRNALGQPSWGQRLKRGVYHGLGVDIRACVDATAWGAWLVISTGPADFNRALVTPRAKGGTLPPGLEWKRDAGFHLYRSGGRVETPTEASFFAALGLPHIEPWERR